MEVARAWGTPPLRAEDIAPGFSAADYETEPVEIWEENHEIFSFFLEISGQWRRAGLDGACVALDYGPVFTLMDRRFKGNRWDEVFEDIRLIEKNALSAMRR